MEPEPVEGYRLLNRRAGVWWLVWDGSRKMKSFRVAEEAVPHLASPEVRKANPGWHWLMVERVEGEGRSSLSFYLYWTAEGPVMKPKKARGKEAEKLAAELSEEIGVAFL